MSNAHLIVRVGWNALEKTGAPPYYVQLGLSDKGRAIKGLVVGNGLYLEHFDLVKSLAYSCYQLSPKT